MPWRRHVLYALCALCVCRVLGFFFIDPIGWGILLVVAIINLVAIVSRRRIAVTAK